MVDQLVELDLERMKLDREEGIVNMKTHVTLLKHIKDVWLEGETFLSTDDIISMLAAKFPSSWGRSERYPNGLTPQRLGRMLVKNYGVYSDRTSSTKIRGYTARSFDRALRSVRMTPVSEPAKPVEPAEPAADEPELGQSPIRGDLCPRCDLPRKIRTDSGLCDFCTTQSQAADGAARRDGAA